MNDQPRATLEKLNAEGNGVRVEFFWLGDRLGHTFSAVKNGVASVEWRSVDDDPLGPVYQELHEQQTDDGGKILFLNGAGNGTHWSASVEFEKGKCVVALDVAARVREQPRERVIEYRSDFEGEPTVLCGDLSGVGESESEQQPTVVRLLPSNLSEQLPTTLRFKYTFIG